MLRATLVSIVAALALSFVAPVTSAQAQGKKKEQKVKSYDFSGDTIDGDLVKPDGEILDTRSFASHTSLIRIRKDFIKEILKSAEDL
jgi:hypothetical protein